MPPTRITFQSSRTSVRPRWFQDCIVYIERYSFFGSNDVITSCCYCKCGLLSISLVSLTIHNRGFYLYWELCEAIALEWGIEQDFLAHQWGIRQWRFASKLLSGVLNIVYSLTQWSVFISVLCPSVAFMLIKISNLGGLIHLADALTRMQKPTYF